MSSGTGKATQSKEALLKSYNKRLRDDVKNIQDNFCGKFANNCILYIFYVYSTLYLI